METVFLYSGGLDSFTLLGDMLANPFRYNITAPPRLIHFRADDPVHRHATSLVTRQVDFFRLRFGKKIAVVTPDLSGFIFTRDAKAPQKERVTADFDQDIGGVTPARNLILLGIALNYAASLKANRVYTAFQMSERRWENLDDDVSDDAPNFVNGFNELIGIGGGVAGQKVYTPFLDARMTKTDIIRLGISLNLPLNLTYSCVWSAPKPCGKCLACLNHKRACKAIGYDPRKETR